MGEEGDVLRLSALVREELVKVGLLASNKCEAMRELAELLVESGQLPPERFDETVVALEEREELSPSGLKNGIAVPHCRADGLGQVLMAVGTSRKGIDFSSPDGSAARLVLLFLIPGKSYRATAGSLEDVTWILDDPALVEEIALARSPAEVVDIIEAEEGRLYFYDFT